LRFGLIPLLPRPFVRFGRRFLGRREVPGWIRPDFARRINLGERIQSLGSVERKFESKAQESVYRYSTSGFQVFSDELAARTAAGFGVEVRHPLQDRRLAEFGLALPEDLRWRRDQPKFILREAMRGLLPEKVRGRLSKGEFSSVFIQALLRRGEEHPFDSLEILHRGWMDVGKICTMYDEAVKLYRLGNERFASHVWTLWTIVGLDLWLNNIAESPKLKARQY